MSAPVNAADTGSGGSRDARSGVSPVAVRTAVELLEAAAGSDDVLVDVAELVCAAVGGDPHVLWMHLASELGDGVALEELARNPHVPRDALEVVAHRMVTEGLHLASFLASNPVLTSELIDVIASRPSPPVSLAVHPNATDDQRISLATRLSNQALVEMLKQHRFRVLDEHFATDPSEPVRLTVARLTSSPVALSRQARDWNRAIRTAVARNAAAPLAVLEQLACDPEPQVADPAREALHGS